MLFKISGDEVIDILIAVLADDIDGTVLASTSLLANIASFTCC